MKNLLFAAVLAFVMLTGCTNNNKESNTETATSDVISFDEVLATRRSVRSYDATKTISEAEVRDGWGAYDNGLSNAYFILKARSKGFDTLIMGMRDSDALRTLFNIPENEAIMAVISLGYRSGEPRQPEHRPLEEVVEFF